MKNTFKKGLLLAMLTTGTLLGSAVANQAKAGGFVCVGQFMYASHGWWIFQFPYGEPLDSVSCEGY
jgi:hypothetical protein